MPTEDRILRQHLLELLRGGSAHITFADALEDFPDVLRGARPKGAPHTAWQLLEHIRIALDDLHSFSTNPDYVAPKWPEAYWPDAEAPPAAEDWDASVRGVLATLKLLEEMVSDEEANLYTPIPWGDGQTILREVLVAADHNAYHLGQLVYLRKQLEGGKR